MRRLVLALGVLAGLAVGASLVVLRHRSTGRAGAGPTSLDPATPARSLGETIETTGRAPSFRVLFDPASRARLCSGNALSDDWGRTWRRLADPDGRTLALLGGRRAVTFAFGPGGRLLLGEVLFEPSGVPPGQGPIAHAAEWSGARWEMLAGPPAPGPAAPPELVVRGVGYLPNGLGSVATPHAIYFSDGSQRETPGEVTAFLAASDGRLYVAVRGATEFPLYSADGVGGPWLPVGGAERVDAIAEGSGGTVFVVGERLGRGQKGKVDWDPSRLGFTVSNLVAHPSAPLVAAWGNDSLLLLSRDAGRSFASVRTADLRVAWVAFDPTQTDSFLVVDRTGIIHRLSLAAGSATPGSTLPS